MNKFLRWSKGLLSAVIHSVASTVVVVVVDPQTFNLDEGLNKLATVALVSGILGAASYLKDTPMPE